MRWTHLPCGRTIFEDCVAGRQPVICGCGKVGAFVKAKPKGRAKPLKYYPFPAETYGDARTKTR